MRKIIHKVQGWIRGRTAVAPQHAKTAFIYIIKPGRQENADLAAGDQVAMLRRFSSFSDKEGIAVTAVFPGRPARKIPDGARQGDVSVRYAAPDGVLRVADQSIKEARKTHAVVVVTDQPDVMKLAKADDCTILCTATFEKTLEAVVGPLKRESREPREPREGREPRENREPREPRENRDRREPRKPAAEAPAGDVPAGDVPAGDLPADQPDQQPPESQAPDAPAAEPASDEPRVDDQPAPVQAAAPRRSQSAPRAEKKETDKAILDLIDPL